MLVLRCSACSWECTVSNPQWAVKWPGHYYVQGRACYSSDCARRYKAFFPEALDILRTPKDANLEEEGFDRQYTLRSCLRTQDECSDLPDAVESWCIRCKEQTKFCGDRTSVIDHNPRWTLGRKPLYVERRPECLLCQHASHPTSRFVPVKLEIASVLPRLVAELARYIVDLDRDIKGSVMDSMLQASVKTYRKDPKTP